MNKLFDSPLATAKQFGPPLLLTLFLTACGGSYETGYSSFSSNKLASDTATDTVKAVKSPLTDLGLMEDEIPAKLEALMSNPYKLTKGTSCDGLKTEMDELNALLGPDIDSPKMSLAEDESTISQGANMVKDAAVGFVKSQVNILPMRSIIRQISGAKKHEKRMARATQAGQLRRAYIKGVATAKFDGKCFIGPAVPVAVEAKNTVTEDSSASETMEVASTQ